MSITASFSLKWPWRLKFAAAHNRSQQTCVCSGRKNSDPRDPKSLSAEVAPGRSDLPVPMFPVGLGPIGRTRGTSRTGHCAA
jgi:hypothetical protein